MEISVIGAGYVGLPAGTALASKGHQITCIDIDEEKVEKINGGECPIHEEGLPELLEEQVDGGNLTATTDTESAVSNSDVTFLSVGTPMNEDGSINLDYIKQAAEDIGKALKEKKGYHLVVVKSTVVPETTEETILPILEEFSGKKGGEDFGICMNPEFLREGTALKDFLNPDRIVIGELDQKSGNLLEKVYNEFDAPVIRTSLKAAEMIKYASNSLLATKISFMNEIGNICKKLGIDTYEVADGVGMDHRIKRDFLNSGCGFGGSCFPKDVRAIKYKAEELGEEPKILESTLSVNEKQKKKMVDILEQKIDIEGKTVAILGLAFKPDTDDIRESPAITIIGELKARGAEVRAYDPEAMENMKEVYPDIDYVKSAKDALENADAALIATDWDEFKEVDEENYPENTLEGKRIGISEGICW